MQTGPVQAPKIKYEGYQEKTLKPDLKKIVFNHLEEKEEAELLLDDLQEFVEESEGVMDVVGEDDKNYYFENMLDGGYSTLSKEYFIN